MSTVTPFPPRPPVPGAPPPGPPGGGDEPPRRGSLLWQTRTLKRRNDVADLVEKGLTHRRISEVLGISYRIVSTDLAALNRMWARECIPKHIEKHRARMIQHCRMTWRLAMEAFELSKTQRKKSSQKTIKTQGQESAPVTLTLEKEDRDGNPRFLEVALRALEREGQLRGLIKIEVTAPVVNIDQRVGLFIEVDDDGLPAPDWLSRVPKGLALQGRPRLMPGEKPPAEWLDPAMNPAIVAGSPELDVGTFAQVPTVDADVDDPDRPA